MHILGKTGALRREVLFFITFLLTLASLSAPLEAGASTTIVEALSGSFGVTTTGAASYSIPIGLPRWAAQPRLGRRRTRRCSRHTSRMRVS